MFVLRLDAATGAKDASFGTNGVIVKYRLLGGYEEIEGGTVYKRGKDEAYSLARDSSGRILVGGGSMLALMVEGTNTSQDNTPLVPFLVRLR